MRIGSLHVLDLNLNITCDAYSDEQSEALCYYLVTLSPSQKLTFDLSTALHDLWSCELSLDFTVNDNIISVIPFEFLLFYYFLSPVFGLQSYILCPPVCLSVSLSKLQPTELFPSLCASFRVMENEEGRKEYLVFPPSKSQCPASSQKGRKIPLKGNGRRIDYILYSDEGQQQDWKLVWFSRGLQGN